MEVINIKEKFEKLTEAWTPQILGEAKGNSVRIFRARGPFIRHKHNEKEEFLLVIKGVLKIKFREQEVTLREGECFIVPKGVEHLPYAEDEAQVLLLELSM